MPALDLAALRKQIQARKALGVYLFYGSDVRLIEQMVDAVEALIDPADRPFAAERIYAGEAGGSAVDITASANVFPMLGDRRIVIVLRAERFLKPARAGFRNRSARSTMTIRRSPSIGKTFADAVMSTADPPASPA